MRSWKKIQDRREATLLFVEALDKEPKLRAACKSDSATARETFQKIGDFDSIPKDVTFAVFEENGPERDKLVVILLPDKSNPRPHEPKDDPMICTSTKGHIIHIQNTTDPKK